MLEVVEEGKEQVKENWMLDEYQELFRKWLNELTEEEKEVWLWNAMVAMKKIEQRRKI